MTSSKFCRFLLLVTVMSIAVAALAAVGGSISGTVKDPSGGVVPGAMLTLTNTALGSQFKTVADNQGLYTFPSLPVGRYDLTIEAPGFSVQKKAGLVIDADAALQINTALEVEGQTAEVSVSAVAEEAEVHVETVATQLGEVVSDAK